MNVLAFRSKRLLSEHNDIGQICTEGFVQIKNGCSQKVTEFKWIYRGGKLEKWSTDTLYSMYQMNV
jgi:hypothetical protein